MMYLTKNKQTGLVGPSFRRLRDDLPPVSKVRLIWNLVDNMDP